VKAIIVLMDIAAAIWREAGRMHAGLLRQSVALAAIQRDGIEMALDWRFPTAQIKDEPTTRIDVGDAINCPGASGEHPDETAVGIVEADMAEAAAFRRPDELLAVPD